MSTKFHFTLKVLNSSSVKTIQGTATHEAEKEFEKHVDLQINQSQLSAIPDYFKKRFEDNDGQDEDYGYKESGGRGIYLKVYGSGFYKIHWDVKDPNSDPIEHLIYDAPRWGAVLFAGIIAMVIFSVYVYKNRKKN